MSSIPRIQQIMQDDLAASLMAAVMHLEALQAHTPECDPDREIHNSIPPHGSLSQELVGCIGSVWIHLMLDELEVQDVL